MTSDPISLTRHELYEQVWSEPMSLLSRKFGLSDVGLAKICRKLRVPTPWRAYWATPCWLRGLGYDHHCPISSMALLQQRADLARFFTLLPSRIMPECQGSLCEAAGVCLGACFFLQSTALMSGNAGTDARFPSRVRQNVVIG